MKKIIVTTKAPAATPLFSQAILESSKYRLEISGQIGLDGNGKFVDGGIDAQTNQTLQNVEGIVSELGWTLENLTKVRIYLVDMANYAKVNEVYATKFTKNPPARIAIAVKALPLEALIEIECVAAGDEISSAIL
ncbi:MAG: Rid family detoxifying hydrolase [Patescibacteria group bacterium]